MGIKHLHKLLQKYAPNCYEKKHLSEFSYKRLAIDISLYIYKYKAIYGDKWIESFIYLISCLRKWNIHCIFVYDNKAPDEKIKEQQRRRETRVKQSERIKNLEKEIEIYEKGGNPSEKIIEICKKEGIVSLLKRDTKESRQIIDIKIVKNKIETMKSMIISITDDDLQMSKELFNILEIPYTKAIMEAEAYSSYLSIHNKVDAVLSEDTDVLAYGSPIFLTKIDTLNDTVVYINYQKMLNELDMTNEMFLDLCIMLGCDYNSNIPKVGPEKSFSLIKKYKNIDNIDEIKNNIEILNHIRVRKLFEIPQKIDFDVPYCGIPNFEKVSEFLFKNNLHFNISKLKRNLGESQLIFIEE
jgi:flap endonuclease-1